MSMSETVQLVSYGRDTSFERITDLKQSRMEISVSTAPSGTEQSRLPDRRLIRRGEIVDVSMFLGLDLSTQSLSGAVVDTEDGSVRYENSVHFGTELPEYACPQGVLENPDPLVKHADPRMWAAALDALCQKMIDDNVPLANIKGISGSGQQHGTVYVDRGFTAALKRNDAALATLVGGSLSRSTSPIWMDGSTSAECSEINKALGGPAQVRGATGSSAVERFSGAQIRKFAKAESQAYGDTARVHLVSSFMCSLMVGENAPIDASDGAGMNLLRLTNGDWHSDLVRATAPGLADRLPPVVPSSHICGTISDYFVRNYGFNPETEVVVWSGDNPSSLIGVGGWEPGTAVISLGTSDTFFAAIESPVVDPEGYGHVFGNPAGGFMCLICFKNGSLAREHVKKTFGLSWQQFDVAAFQETPAGNHGNLLLPYVDSEITPFVLDAGMRYRGTDTFCKGQNPFATVRALVEAQAMSLRLHSQWTGKTPRVVRVTGGASKSDGMCQVIADVFGARVERLQTGNSAVLGAAMRAANAIDGASWLDLSNAFCQPIPGKDVHPIPEHNGIYGNLAREYAVFEAECLTADRD